MTQYGYALLGFTAMVAMLAAVLTFAVLRFIAGARKAGRHLQEGGIETTLLSAALQDAMTRLQAQERAMSARAVASEQLSGQIVESITAGLLVVDGAGRVEILNPAGRRLLDVTTDPIGADYRDLLAAAPLLRDAVAECLATGQPIVRRSLQIPGSGRSLRFGVTVSPLAGGVAGGVVGADGRGAICLFSDLTKVFELEEQLRLKETLARLGELTAGIAHEFRNGLATIHGYSRLITPEALPAQYQPYLEGIRLETQALGQVVTNFLNFARPETVSLVRVALGPLARRTEDDLRLDLPAGTTIEAVGEFGEIEGDEVLLRQVFSNLVRNAAEACEASGVQPAIVIEGHMDAKRGSCSVTVADNGPGIPESARDRVFQPFFTTRSRGTGLGLAIVQKIMVLSERRCEDRSDVPAGLANPLLGDLRELGARRQPCQPFASRQRVSVQAGEGRRDDLSLPDGGRRLWSRIDPGEARFLRRDACIHFRHARLQIARQRAPVLLVALHARLDDDRLDAGVVLRLLCLLRCGCLRRATRGEWPSLDRRRRRRRGRRIARREVGIRVHPGGRGLLPALGFASRDVPKRLRRCDLPSKGQDEKCRRDGPAKAGHYVLQAKAKAGHYRLRHGPAKAGHYVLTESRWSSRHRGYPASRPL